MRELTCYFDVEVSDLICDYTPIPFKIAAMKTFITIIDHNVSIRLEYQLKYVCNKDTSIKYNADQLFNMGLPLFFDLMFLDLNHVCFSPLDNFFCHFEN